MADNKSTIRLIELLPFGSFPLGDSNQTIEAEDAMIALEDFEGADPIDLSSSLDS